MFESNSMSMSVAELLNQGGWAMVPIYACSVLVVGVFVHKLLELRSAGLHRLQWLDTALEHLANGEAERSARSCSPVLHPAARVIEAALAAIQRRPDLVEAEAKRVASLELRRLETNVGALAFLAQIAPLLGLLGTVLGMVDLFMGLQGAEHGNISIGDLSSGIWKALLTTAAGLMVAVPALAAHAYLGSRIDRVRTQLVDVIQRVLFHLPSTGAVER